MKNLTWLFLFVVSIAYSQENSQREPVDYVNPQVETTKSRYFFFNSACWPFGMMNLSPDNVLAKPWHSGYRYQEPFVRGLTHVHAWGAGGLLIMPATDTIDPTGGPEVWKSSFSHENEKAQVGYHQLYLDDSNTKVELTSTTRVGFHRYTFNKEQTARIIVSLGDTLGAGIMKTGELTLFNENEIQGWVEMGQYHYGWNDINTKLFFVLQFDRPVKEMSGWDKTGLKGKTTHIEGDQAGIYIDYPVKKGEQLHIKAAISWCSIEQARLNLHTELPHWDFDRIHRESREEWNQWLGKIEVYGGSEENKVKFYTDLWHTLLGRRQINDVNGKYPDQMSGKLKVKQLYLDENGKPMFMHLNSDSWWLSKWNLNTIWGLAYPRVLNDVVNSNLVYYRDGGNLPRGPFIGRYSWIMTSAPITELIVSAYQKGIRNYNISEAYLACKKAHGIGGTMDMFGGRMDWYVNKRFIPEYQEPHVWGGAGRVMECAAQDWGLSQFALAQGKADDYQYYLNRSQNWVNHFDPETGFIRPRNEDGSWLEPFDPLRDGNHKGFVEANSWQTSWIATHDVKGMANLLGGLDAYCDKLNYAFEGSEQGNFISGMGEAMVNYANEVGLVMAHLFNYAGKPWLTQKWVRKVLKQTYGGITPESGYGGFDEDQGQLGGISALMAIGLFEARGGCDVNPVYEITAPVFDSVKIHLDHDFYEGNVFTITTKNNSPQNVYIQSAQLNGTELDNCWFYHSDFQKGGVLELELGAQPNKKWGTEVLPPSETKDLPDFLVSKVILPEQVKAGEDFIVELDVQNNGDMGVYRGEITWDGQVIGKTSAVLLKGEKKKINVKVLSEHTGKSRILVDGQKFSFLKVN